MTEQFRKGDLPYRNNEAPVIYFDFVGAVGSTMGIIQIELAAGTLIPNQPGGGADTEMVPVGRLRCSIEAAKNLQRGIEKALELHQRLLQQQQQPSAEADLPKLN